MWIPHSRFPRYHTDLLCSRSFVDTARRVRNIPIVMADRVKAARVPGAAIEARDAESW
ncbi:protein of unknown function [Caballeronia sp. S22]